MRPNNKFKGHKIYILYSDGFKIWHDLEMQYIGIEDTNNKNSKNLMPYFNKENENTFIISVSNTLVGKAFLNYNLNNNNLHIINIYLSPK